MCIWTYTINSMKSKLFCSAAFFGAAMLSAQQFHTEERMQEMRAARADMMVQSLKVSPKEEAEFRRIYSEYHDSQRKIKSRFSSDFNPEKLSDAEALQKLNESFEVGEALLNNRRAYSQKMQSVLSPQQVLKLFSTEGMVRQKIIHQQAAHECKAVKKHP